MSTGLPGSQSKSRAVKMIPLEASTIKSPVFMYKSEFENTFSRVPKITRLDSARRNETISACTI